MPGVLTAFGNLRVVEAATVAEAEVG